MPGSTFALNPVMLRHRIDDYTDNFFQIIASPTFHPSSAYKLSRTGAMRIPVK